MDHYIRLLCIYSTTLFASYTIDTLSTHLLHTLLTRWRHQALFDHSSFSSIMASPIDLTTTSNIWHWVNQQAIILCGIDIIQDLLYLFPHAICNTCYVFDKNQTINVMDVWLHHNIWVGGVEVALCWISSSSPFYTRRHEPRHSERTHTWELPFWQSQCQSRSTCWCWWHWLWTTQEPSHVWFQEHWSGK